MKDNIQDLVKYVTSTGFFDKIKVNADSNGVVIEALEKEKDVVLKGSFANPIDGLNGEFGLSNLSLLGHISSDQEFSSKESILEVIYEKKNNEDVPVELKYVNKSKSHINYRFMAANLVPPQPKFIKPEWDVVVKPAKAKIEQFAWAANGLSAYEQYFIPKIENGELKFYIGDANAASQRGAVTFASDLKETFDNKNKWRIEHIQPVLKLAISADCEMAFSSKGVIQITINTGVGVYKFIFPAKSA
jgi:hypothetical protein